MISKPRPRYRPSREGRYIPLTLWRCWCGRRFRGDARLEPHLERSGHGIAVGINPHYG